MLNIPPHLEACRPRGLFSIFHGTSSPVARRCPRASDLVLSAEHAFLLYERPGLHLQSGASAVGGVLHGARRQVWAGLADPMRISIHAPRAGGDHKLGNRVVHLRISIHAPRAGCDSIVHLSAAAIADFNPRTPCGVRHHAGGLPPATEGISIHAPRAGCDLTPSTRSVRPAHFNPRTPCGVRLPACTQPSHASNFNPRTPCGVRLQSGHGRRVKKYFNPRTPCGVRRQTGTAKRTEHGISIHAPRAGCDPPFSIAAKIIFCISIHAPRAGCDRTAPPAPHPRLISIHAPRAGCDARAASAARDDAGDFNPRTPCGVRRRRRASTSGASSISIHAPRAGCDCWRWRSTFRPM